MVTVETKYFAISYDKSNNSMAKPRSNPLMIETSKNLQHEVNRATILIHNQWVTDNHKSQEPRGHMVYLSYRLLFTGQLAKSNIKLFVGVNLIFHQNNIANQQPKIQQFSPDWSLMVTTLSDVWHQFNSHHFLTLLPHQYWPWSHHSANYPRTVKLSPNYMGAFTSDILAHPHQVKYYTSQHYHKIMTTQQHFH